MANPTPAPEPGGFEGASPHRPRTRRAEPLFGLRPDGSLDLDAALRLFGHEQFRPGQRESIETLLERGRLLLVAPTGGGKSLTYQLPAALLPGTSLVISPLIALMNDQVSALHQHGIPATFLASTLGGDELRARMRDLTNGAFKLVYVAPERLGFPGFRELLGRISVPLVAIDEAHCISEWGHDFRPEYMQIGEFIGTLPAQTRVLACTATATPVVRDEILAKLALGDRTTQIVRGFARPNLRLRAREVGRRERTQAIDELLASAIGKPRKATGTAIVYSPTRKLSEEQAVRLAAEGWRCQAYHAGLEPELRDAVQRAFSSGALDIVVATNAFGMGIDRSDVRAVIHLAPPGSIEAYYQEVGRAGRDGEPAWGLLCYTSQDLPLRRRLLENDIDGRAPDPEIVEHKWNMFLELIRWAEGGSCRHDAILRYFGDEAEILQGCGHCDVCEALTGDSEFDEEQTALIVRKALSGVARIDRRFGLLAAINLLAGQSDDRLARSGLDQVKTFGALATEVARYGEAWLKKLLHRCVAAGWVEYAGTDRPLAALTREGREVMLGRRPARIVLPPTEVPQRGAGERPRRSERAPERSEQVELDARGQALFEALRAHRLEVARRDEVPPYVVASDRSLREIALLRPRTIEQLQQAHGIGPAKAEKYGEGLLAVIVDEG